MRATIDQISIFRLGMNIYTSFRYVSSEFSKDLLQDIFHGNDSLNVAILIYDKTDTFFGLLEINQLRM